MNSDTAKDLWNIFSTNHLKAVEGAIPPRTKPTEAEYAEAYDGVPPPTLSDEDLAEIEAELKHRERIREIEALREMQAEAARHDW